ncbi:YncE family protein [Microbacterium sp. CPCC 204701]|uniref:YncE family protein n=1 Tax=Microbacterium sp. CPCC 204701 TaxID=2493084 RepID=UPI000FD8D65C|nr:hypothetical protein [Microbacterium sp. CPCC 204701]
MSRRSRHGDPARVDLLVVNKADRHLGLIDLARGAQSHVVPLSGVTGHEVAVTADGRTAFVPIYSDAGVGEPGVDGRTVDVVDTASAERRRTHDLGAPARPHDAISAGDGILYLTAEARNEVLLLDERTLALVGAIPTGAEQSHMLALSADRTVACTANVRSGSVSVLDVPSRSLRGVVPVSDKVNRIAMSADGRLAFTADQTTPRMAVVDVPGLRLASWIELPGIGFGSALTRDNLLVVALRAEHAVAIIDFDPPHATRVVDVPGGPQAIVLDDEHRRAYSACHLADVVVEIDLPSALVTRIVPTGRNPDGLCWVGRADGRSR